MLPLIVLANKDYFIERQGNFGNLLTGHAAAAPRYIECRLTDLALETMFHPALTEFVLLGNVAVRDGGEIEWDVKTASIANIGSAKRYLSRPAYRKGWL